MESCIIWCKKKNSDFFWKKDFTVALRELIFAISRILDNYIGQKQRITPGDDRRNIKSRNLIPAKINSLKVLKQ